LFIKLGGISIEAALLIDFGSTYTKLTLVDIEREIIIGTAKDLTTAEEGVMTGYQKTLHTLLEKIPNKDINISHKFACSSAAGGLKMVAIGLVQDLTGEAAKRAALGAGARVLDTFCYELTKQEIEKISSLQPDILLLAGGTDGGNKSCIIHNARLIAEFLPDIPVVVSGNQKANDEIQEIFQEQGIDYYIVANVMPNLNMLQVEPARETIRKIFMEKIIETKGIDAASALINNVIIPTPAAVLDAAQLLSKGTSNQSGLGSLMVLDIGGATTDVHSIGEGDSSQPGIVKVGLPEPFAKRTVEGDLGMRISATSLYEVAGYKKISNWISEHIEYVNYKCQYLTDHISFIPQKREDILFDNTLAKVASEIAMKRHVGVIERIYTPSGYVYSQKGKDMADTKYIIATGGVIMHSPDPASIVQASFINPDESQYLLPKHPTVLIDRHYILSAMGLLAQKFPDKAFNLMKKYLIKEYREEKV